MKRQQNADRASNAHQSNCDENDNINISDAIYGQRDTIGIGEGRSMKYQMKMEMGLPLNNDEKMVYLGVFKLAIKQEHWLHYKAKYEREGTAAQQQLINKYLLGDAKIVSTKYQIIRQDYKQNYQFALMIERGNQINKYIFEQYQSSNHYRLINLFELGSIAIKQIEPLPKIANQYKPQYCIALSIYTSTSFLDFCNQHYKQNHERVRKSLYSYHAMQLNERNKQVIKNIDNMIKLIRYDLVSRQQLFQGVVKDNTPLVKRIGINNVDVSQAGDMQQEFLNNSIRTALDQSCGLQNKSVISFSFIMETNAGKFFDLQQTQIPATANPLGFRGQLMPFQKKALTWMLHRQGCVRHEKLEVTDCPYWTNLSKRLNLPFDFFCNQTETALVSGRKIYKVCDGGILADEMGLGKTIMLISLMLAHPADDNLQQKQTLIIAPKSLIGQWKQKIQQFAPQLKSLVFYGKINSRITLQDYDVIITTQSKLRWITNQSVKDEQSIQAAILYKQWFRIIVDEAHNFRNSQTKMAKALCELNAKYRWALTGTPTQNSLSDMHSLLKFLKVYPWGREDFWLSHFPAKPADVSTNHFYLLKDVLKGIMLRRKKKSKNEKGEELLKLPDVKFDMHEVQMSQKTKELYRILEAKAENDYAKLLFLEKMNFTKKHKAVKKVMSESKRNMVFRILGILINMRQLCCHEFLANYTPDYVPFDKFKHAYLKFRGSRAIKRSPKVNFFQIYLGIKPEKLKYTQTAELEKVYPYWDNKFQGLAQGHKSPCFICGNQNPSHFTPCLHLFCLQCITRRIKDHRFQSMLTKATEFDQQLQSLSRHTKIQILQESITSKIKHEKLQKFNSICPACRQPLNIREIFPLPKQNQFGEDFDNFKPNEKLMQLQKYIGKMKLDEKAIIYTSFLGMIRLLEFTVRRMGHENNYRVLSGRNTVEDRIRINQQFNKKQNVRFLIMTLKVGAVGFNFQAANWVFLMDPWWNPAIQQQAIGRAYRFGQARQVNIVRFVTKNSVEARIAKANFTKKSVMDRLLDIDNIQKDQSYSSKRSEISYLLQMDEGTGGQLDLEQINEKIRQNIKFIEQMFEEKDNVMTQKQKKRASELKQRMIASLKLPQKIEDYHSFQQEMQEQDRQIADIEIPSSGTEIMSEGSSLSL